MTAVVPPIQLAGSKRNQLLLLLISLLELELELENGVGCVLGEAEGKELTE